MRCPTSSKYLRYFFSGSATTSELCLPFHWNICTKYQCQPSSPLPFPRHSNTLHSHRNKTPQTCIEYFVQLIGEGYYYNRVRLSEICARPWGSDRSFVSPCVITETMRTLYVFNECRFYLGIRTVNELLWFRIIWETLILYINTYAALIDRILLLQVIHTVYSIWTIRNKLFGISFRTFSVIFKFNFGFNVIYHFR